VSARYLTDEWFAVVAPVIGRADVEADFVVEHQVDDLRHSQCFLDGTLVGWQQGVVRPEPDLIVARPVQADWADLLGHCPAEQAAGATEYRLAGWSSGTDVFGVDPGWDSVVPLAPDELRVTARLVARRSPHGTCALVLEQRGRRIGRATSPGAPADIEAELDFGEVIDWLHHGELFGSYIHHGVDIQGDLFRMAAIEGTVQFPRPSADAARQGAFSSAIVTYARLRCEPAYVDCMDRVDEVTAPPVTSG
jgi:hypothetical protein